MKYKLSDISYYVSDKINITKIGLDKYISTENMLPDRGGVVMASSLPTTPKVNSFNVRDVLFSNIRTYFRKVWFASFSGGVSNDVLVIRSKDNNILNDKFLYYVLSDENFINHSITTAKGTKMPRGDKSALMNFELDLPSLPTQKKIAHILSTLDDKIELNRKMNQTLEEMASAIFKSWFVDFDPVHAKLTCKDDVELESAAKELGISKAILDLFPSEFIESELGMIPKGWEIKQFNSLVKHLKPGTNYQPDRVEDGIPFVNGKHIQDGFLDLTDIKYITQDEYDRVHKSWQPEAYDVLITRIGTLGKVGVIMPSDLPLALHYNSIDIKAGKLNHQFLYFLLKSDFFQKQFHTNKKQAVQEFITIEAVEQLKILMPNSEKIFEILSGIFDSYFNLIEINTNHIRTLEKTRDTLLPKLLSGEIDVSELEI